MFVSTMKTNRLNEIICIPCYGCPDKRYYDFDLVFLDSP